MQDDFKAVVLKCMADAFQLETEDIIEEVLSYNGNNQSVIVQVCHFVRNCWRKMLLAMCIASYFC